VGKQPCGSEEESVFKAKVVNEMVIIISRRGVALPHIPAGLPDHQKRPAAKSNGSQPNPSIGCANYGGLIDTLLTDVRESVVYWYSIQ
jgi:hypothetical protein